MLALIPVTQPCACATLDVAVQPSQPCGANRGRRPPAEKGLASSLLLIDDARPLFGCLRCVCFADWGIICLQSLSLRSQHHVFVEGSFFLPAGPASLHCASYFLPACSPRRATVMSTLCSAARKLRHATRSGRCERWMIASDALVTVLGGLLRPASDVGRLLACCPRCDVQLQSWVASYAAGMRRPMCIWFLPWLLLCFT
jgi:hypothetical protein